MPFGMSPPRIARFEDDHQKRRSGRVDRPLLFWDDLFTCVDDVPDSFGAIVGDEQRTVFGYRNTHRPTPDLAVRGDEAGQEVLVFAGGVTVFHWNADNF